jgi:purine-binding chemotaxis protein CheW
MESLRQFCTFWLDDLFFGIDVRCIQEVIRHHEMTRVPRASRIVRGLINLRGQVVMAIDLRHRIGLPPLPSESESINVIIRTEERLMSLLVDKVGDILDLNEEQMEAPPETVRGEVRELIVGIYQLSDRLLLVLDAACAAEFDATTISAI